MQSGRSCQWQLKVDAISGRGQIWDMEKNWGGGGGGGGGAEANV